VSLWSDVPGQVVVRSHVLAVSLGRLPVAARVMVAAVYAGIVFEDAYAATLTTIPIASQKVTTYRGLTALVALYSVQIEAYEAHSFRSIENSI